MSTRTTGRMVRRALALTCMALPFTAFGQTPYSGTPIQVPGSFEAENFDRGGQGAAYHDNISGNAGGQYRPGEDVDIVSGPQGGFVVNNFQTGEWLGYTINVPASGSYDVELRVATNIDFAGSSFHLEVDGANLTGSVVLPDTGGWSSFQWHGRRTIPLSAGTRFLKVVSDRQYFNLDALRVTARDSGQAQELMPASAGTWSSFAPRSVSAPGAWASSGSAGYVLNLAGNGVANVYGGWRTRVTGLRGSTYYRFKARAVARDIVSLRESVTVLLRWRGSFGAEVTPDYVWNFIPQTDGAVLLDRVIQTPPGTNAVDVELVLQWSPGGQVAFDQLSLKGVAAPPARPVRVAAVHYRPSGSTSGQDSVRRAAAYAEQVAIQHRPDVMVLGELLNVIGAPGTLQSKAEPVPGPSTDAMAAVARSYSVNIVFGMLEASGNTLYNTAVLLDRNGDIRGKYHKVQLPVQDASAGIAPGSSVPVFDTDVGRVGLLICHDTSFPEPAREAALQGAELLLVPIWGGRSALVRARAIENSVYVASAGYDYASEVVDSRGNVLARIASVNGGPQVAVADIDLSLRFPELWLGDWRDIASKERRDEPYRFRVP